MLHADLQLLLHCTCNMPPRSANCAASENNCSKRNGAIWSAAEEEDEDREGGRERDARVEKERQIAQAV